jgi:hypothetical protein
MLGLETFGVCQLRRTEPVDLARYIDDEDRSRTTSHAE